MRGSSTLEKFIDDYINMRGDVSSPTTKNYQLTRENLVGYFGADRPLRDITAGDAVEFRPKMIADGLADSTTRKR